MSQVQKVGTELNQNEFKRALLAIGQKVCKDASNGAPVSSMQVHQYIEELNSLVVTPTKKSLAAEVREWVLSSDGIFASSDIRGELCLTRESAKLVGNILGRLKKERVIVPVGDRQGRYRRVDRSLAPMDWQNANIDTTFNLFLPLGLHNYMHLYPKNIIVIAGNTNAGKTAYLLNLVRQNALTHKIDYFTNDLTEEELKKRVQRFADAGMDTDPFDACNFIPRVTNFLDVINPDGVTIIDYLKLTDKFWLVAEDIDQIYQKLQHGVAIIAIQKDSRAKMGRGGEFAAEAPRLYFTLEKGKINIIKMKNLIDPTRDLNGKYAEFDLLAGCKFVPKGSWQGGTS